MTQTERQQILQIAAQILGDMQGNRVTHTQYVGAMTVFEQNLPAAEPATEKADDDTVS